MSRTDEHQRALDLLLSLVVDDHGTQWGQRATEWQLADADHILDPDSDRPYSFVTRPRGGGKTEDLAAIGLCVLLEQAPRLSKSFGLAGDRDQSRLLLDSVEMLVDLNPKLEAAVTVDRWMVTARASGASLEILAADAVGTWGKRPFFVICDERANWSTTEIPERLWRATWSAMIKNPRSRLAVITNVSDPSHPAKKILDDAKASPLWYVNEVPGPLPWHPPELLEEQRRTLPPWEFARLHENAWAASADKITNASDVDACIRPEPFELAPRPGVMYVCSLDIGLVNDATVATISHAEDLPEDGEEERSVPFRTVVDAMQVWQGTHANPVSLAVVENWVYAAHKDYNRCPVRFDPHQAAYAVQNLQDHGVKVIPHNFSPTSNSAIALALFRALRAHALEIPKDDNLRSQLLNLRLIETSPGSYRLDHRAGEHDDMAVTVAMGVHHWIENPPKKHADLMSFSPTGLTKRGGSAWALRHMDTPAADFGARPW